MPTPTVSVVVPAYNARGTIVRAVRSILDQTAGAHEIIVVDDGSSDGTAAAVRSLRDTVATESLTLVELGRNRGPSYARNVGWDKASGEFVAFLDADDSWHPRKIEIQSCCMVDRPECAFSAHRVLRVAQSPYHAAVPGPWPCREILPWRVKVSSFLLWPSCLMMKTGLPYRFDTSRRYCEDRLLLLQMLCSGCKAFRLEVPLGYRYKAPYGQSGLSQDLWLAERGELSAFRRLRQAGLLGWGEDSVLMALSLAKYVGRASCCKLRGQGRNSCYGGGGEAGATSNERQSHAL
jgi:teichuronic acid biosynthesis glycosyltransferase TuaG